MSGLENSVKAVVLPMMLGQRTTLAPHAQLLLVQWVTLKLMVAEQNRPAEAIWRQADQQAFAHKRVIPSGLRIWIAQCYSDMWRNAYLRHAATLGTSVASRPDGSGKNSQMTSFGMGQLFVVAMASTAKDVDLGKFFVFDERLCPLWPLPQRDIHWPPPAPLTHENANRIAMGLEELMQHEKVLWHP